jgi:hypothetical protein
MSKIFISITLIICLLKYVELKPGASNCVQHCLSNGVNAYKYKGHVIQENLYWCGIDKTHASSFNGTSCSDRSLEQCETLDKYCAIVETTDGKACKGFCGACCSTGERTGSCYSDSIPRCSILQNAAAKSKLK